MRIEYGPRQSDRYGRLLHYVYTESAESIAEKLIQEDRGRAWTQDGQHRDLLVELEDEARKRGSGCLWGATSVPEAAGYRDQGQTRKSGPRRVKLRWHIQLA